MVFFISCDFIDLRGAFGIGASVDDRYEFCKSENFRSQFNTLYANADEYTVYAASDIHTDEKSSSANHITFMQAVNADDAAVCCLSIGDMVSGKEAAYANYQKVLLDFPEVKHAASLGNHELQFGGWQHYKEIFGSSIYYFEVCTPNSSDMFICLDSGSGTLGKNQLNWLKALLKKERKNYRKCIIFTHTNFFCRDLSQGEAASYLLEEMYALFHLFGSYNVSLVLSGHDHYFEDTSMQGVKYLTLDAAEDTAVHASYLKIKISETIEYERVKFR